VTRTKKILGAAALVLVAASQRSPSP